MGKSFLGNEITDTSISIPTENFAEYQQLLKARQIIVSLIEENGGISVPLLLTVLGGARASELYRRLKEEK